MANEHDWLAGQFEENRAMGTIAWTAGFSSWILDMTAVSRSLVCAGGS